MKRMRSRLLQLPARGVCVPVRARTYTGMLDDLYCILHLSALFLPYLVLPPRTYVTPPLCGASTTPAQTAEGCPRTYIVYTPSAYRWALRPGVTSGHADRCECDVHTGFTNTIESLNQERGGRTSKRGPTGRGSIVGQWKERAVLVTDPQPQSRAIGAGSRGRTCPGPPPR